MPETCTFGVKMNVAAKPTFAFCLNKSAIKLISVSVCNRCVQQALIL